VSEIDAYEPPPGYGDTIGKCLTFAEIEALLAAERERCAAVAIQCGGTLVRMNMRKTSEFIARAIRALPSPLPAPATPHDGEAP